MSAAPDVSDDDLPRPFGGYLLLQNFARGGMGEVYLAKSGGIAGLERTCVLKKLRAELTRDREYVTRFIDEARVVVTLNHANICNVFDVGRVGEEYYLAMEYVSGRDVRTLQDRCRKNSTPASAATSLHLVCETLEALDYAHRRKHPVTHEPLNLVHRDVSPQNVLVSYEGEVKLIDFGLAASRLKVERTQPNVVMGKMAYMAPEQARGDPIDSRADLFACGVLAYELLTNERYYEGMTANDIWQVAGRGGFIPRAWSTLDAPLASIIAKALHPDVKRRFATCGDFREALLGYSHERWPGAGARPLRALMEQVFVEEIARERAALARFGTITIAAFRTEIESTQSHSVSLAAGDSSDEASSSGSASRLVKDELTSSGSTPRERDTLHDDQTALAAERPRSLIHEERTMVTNPSQKALKRRQQEQQQTSETVVFDRKTNSRKNDATTVVNRSDIDDSVTDGIPGDTTSIDVPGGKPLWIGGAALVGLLCVGIVLVVVNGGENEVPKPPNHIVAATNPPLPPAPPTPPPPATTNPPTEDIEVAPLEDLPLVGIKDKPRNPKNPNSTTTNPKATPTTTNPKATPTSQNVDKAYWEALANRHKNAECVKKLIPDMVKLAGGFVGARQAEIKACAATVGFKK